MSPFAEILKKILGLKNLIKNVKFFSSNKNCSIISYTDNRKTLNININNLDTQKRKQIEKAIRETVAGQGDIVLNEESEGLLGEISSIDEKINEDLKYFKNKIPDDDLPILRASLFLKSQYESKKPVENLKQDIVNRYGERGRRIANLCSAGYFKTVIKPLYNTMASSGNFAKDDFLYRYREIINTYPFAVFVNIFLSEKKIKKKVLNKIEINKKYGIKCLNIHGIGKKNIVNIKKVLEDQELKGKFEREPEMIDSGINYVTAKIFF